MADHIKRFRDALEGGMPEGVAAPVDSRAWPVDIARTVYDAEYALEHQVLDDRQIEGYLAHLRLAKPQRGSARATDTRRAPPINTLPFADLGRQWTGQRYPLVLSEFLAYKCSLAYRSPRDIRRDLMAVGSDGRRYNDDVAHYAFFDTTHPSSSVRHGDTQAFAFVHHRTGYVIFRGTSSFADIWTDVRFQMTTKSYPGLPEKEQTLVGKPTPARHTGFAIAWGSVAPDVEAWAAEQLGERRMDAIVFSGHSLGGALAILAAHQFATKRICPVNAVITFGAPRVGGADFKNSYDALGLHNRTLRVEAADDAIAGFSGHSGPDDDVGYVWPFQHRPLRPAWQMYLFTWLIDRRVQLKKRPSEAAEKDRATEAKPAARAKPNTEPPRHTWRAYLLGLALKLVWYTGRAIVRLQAAHSVEHRYGLFISTLAYRKIRAHRIDEAQLRLLARRGQEVPRIVLESAYKTASEDLSLHLGAVRGRHPRTFRHLAKLPIRVKSQTAFDTIAKTYQFYIA